MNIQEFLRQYTESIGGQFTDYDHITSVIVVPMNDGRYQTVVATTHKSPVSGREQVLFSSKVCPFDQSLDLKMLLEHHGKFDYSKFLLEDDFLKVEASGLTSSINENQLKEMIQEVAQLADHFEFKFTGADVF